jgi:hypothetical protein
MIMEAIVAEGATFEHAHELPNKGGQPAAKQEKSSPGGNSGGTGKGNITSRFIPKPAGRILTEMQVADREIQTASLMKLVLVNGKRKFVRASEYGQFRAGLE